MFVKSEGLLVYINSANVVHQSVQPQNSDFNSYIYILYYQTNMHYYLVPN